MAQPKAEVRRSAALNIADAEKEGRALVSGLLAQKPVENATNTGVLSVRQGRGKPRECRVSFEIYATATNWVSVYRTVKTSDTPPVTLTILHANAGPNCYLLASGAGGSNAAPQSLAGDAAMIPFAGSDFWIADLGLEFLHWPQQRVLKKELRHSRSATVLESTHPHPAAGGYSRVVSWIDNEAGGILHADAYDASNELMKSFDPKGVKEVQGRYELEGMEIKHELKNSVSSIKFDLP